MFWGTEARLFCMALRDRKDSIFLGWMKMESTLIHDYNLKKTSDFLRLMKMECFFKVDDQIMTSDFLFAKVAGAGPASLRFVFLP